MQNVGDLNREFIRRAQSAKLQVDCVADGKLDAKIVVIAEAPGPRETQMKVPLIGGTGKLLWENLQRFGITRRDCYITNVVKRQLVDDAQVGKNGVTRNELSHWKALLEWELAQLSGPTVVLALGGIALEALTGETGVDSWRGSVVYRTDSCPVVVTYNPANLFRRPSLEPIFRLDLSKLDMVVRGTFREHNINTMINPSPDTAIRFMEQLMDEKLPTAFDVEVIGNETACVGFASSNHAGMCINFRDRTTNRWSCADERRVRLVMQRVLLAPDVPLIAQNGGFDCGWLWYKDRMPVKPLWMDTLLAHHTLHPSWPHNLGFLTSQYTTHPFYKDDKDAWREGGDIDTFWRYNVKDCCITRTAALKLDAELKKQPNPVTGTMANFFYGHVMKLQPRLVEATVLGNNIDQAMKDRLAEEYAADVARLKDRFVAEARAATGEDTIDPNPASPKQLSDLLFRRLRLHGRTTSTNAENRRYMAEHPRTPEAARLMLSTLDEWAKQNKLLGTYITAKVDEDGRFRSDYKQYGVASAPGRLSSTQTLWGSGMNLQNQPERLRGMYITDKMRFCDNGQCASDDMCWACGEEDLVYVYFDGAQAEARIVAYEARIDKWKEQFERARLNPGSYDAHIALASDMYGVPYDEVPKHDYNPDGSLTLRAISKRCRHGLNYRMQPARLASVTRMPIPLAQTAFNAYHWTTPELRRWWDEVIEEVKTTRQLFSCLGRRMEFLGSRIDEALFDAVIAFKPQSALGDKVTYVQRAAPEDDEWPMYARIPFNNHDSLTALCRQKDAKTVARIMRKYMEEPLIIKGEQLIIPSDFKQSYADEQGVHRWSNMKKLILD